MKNNKIGFVQNQKNFFGVIFSSNLPWIRIAIALVLTLTYAKFLANSSIILTEIMSSELSDVGMVWEYGFLTLQVSLAMLGVGIFKELNQYLISRRLQEASLDKFLALETKKLDEIGTASLISRVAEDSTFMGDIFVQITLFVQYAVYLITYSGAVLEANQELGQYILPSIGVSLIFIVIAAMVVGREKAKWRTGTSKYVAYMSEKLSDIKFIKARNTEENELVKSRVELNKLFKINFKLNIITTWVQSLLSSLQPIVFKSTVLLFGSKLVIDGDMVPSDLNAFIYAAAIIPDYVQTLATCIVTIRTNQTQTANLTSTYNFKVEDFVSGKDITGDVEDLVFENVDFSYVEDKQILKNLNFRIPKNKITAIVGPSGSGKTTILKLLERLYEPTSGTIKFGDEDVENVNLRAWRKSFGYIVQNSPLLAGTIRDNINYGLHGRVDELTIEEACDLAHVTEFIDKIDGGLDSPVGELGSKLSGGQRQRVAIARALIANNNYLLLDEATASLDKSSESKVVNAINKHMRDNNKTLVVVAHNFSTISEADNIIVMDKGQVVSQGTHTDLYKKCKLYKKLVDLQNF